MAHANPEYTLEIHQLDVGQGDSALILVKEGDEIRRSVLLDGGFVGKYKDSVSLYLERQNIDLRGLDIVISSHYDEDHFGGIRALVKNGFYIKQDTTFVDPGLEISGEPYSDEYHQLVLNFVWKNLTMVEKESIAQLCADKYQDTSKIPLDKVPGEVLKELRNAQNRNWLFRVFVEKGDKKVEVKPTGSLRRREAKNKDTTQTARAAFDKSVQERWLTANVQYSTGTSSLLVGQELFQLPGDGTRPKMTCIGMNASPDDNDRSLAFAITYKNFSFFTAGDLPSGKRTNKDGREDYLVSLYNLNDGNNLTGFKAGHHGSKHSTSDFFLKKAKPQFALISAGKNNTFNHPHEEVVERLKTNGKSLVFLTTVGGSDYQKRHGTTQTSTDRFIVAGSEENDGIFLRGDVIVKVDHNGHVDVVVPVFKDDLKGLTHDDLTVSIN